MSTPAIPLIQGFHLFSIRTFVAVAAASLFAVGCTQKLPRPDLGSRYNHAAKYHGPERNPVIVIPGILGSKLVDQNGTLIWGAFSGGSANPSRDEVARKVALPMAHGVPLGELQDTVRHDGALDHARLSVFGLPVQSQAYAQILATLGVGGYRDQQLAESGAVDYGSDHYTCYQFAYDWRRDNVENARLLYRFIQDRKVYVQQRQAEEFGGKPEDYDVTFDVVAHSMGGLLLRYMMRFGDQDLPTDGSTPEVTWAGADLVDKAVLVGTPNAGTPKALMDLTRGVKFSPFHGAYSPAILSSMPSIYQLLPRDHHRSVALPNSQDSLFDPAVWQRYGWGLADSGRDDQLKVLLPDLPDAAARAKVARDHLSKCLARAKAFHQALDQQATVPDGLRISLFLGDGQSTVTHVDVSDNGGLSETATTEGDGTVPRYSVIFDNREGQDSGDQWTPYVPAPVAWHDINILFAEHLGLTSDSTFSNNLLFYLLDEE